MASATILISEIKKVKTGESQYGPWAFWLVVDGNEDTWPFLSPRDKELLQKIQDIGAGKHAELEYETDEKGKRVTSVEEAKPSANGETPKLGTGEYVRGQTAPTDARRMLGCKAGDIAAALAGQFVGRMPQQEWTPALICAFYDALEDHVFTQLLRRGNLMEDSDIPFLPEYKDAA